MSADTKKPSKEMDGYFILESDPQIFAKWGKNTILNCLEKYIHQRFHSASA
jgi:hypothetical protein